ncbi:hypothetical protein [Algiphilus aromaticivorans]|jgi:hypothetical protein|uniref:hypothetical protein n=1 Tax=Algiphilus aromaticivorans TaxID=382454 RepID=UPI0005C20985|nr:hypothetical protein [Algiphilus aromaticivorans]
MILTIESRRNRVLSRFCGRLRSACAEYDKTCPVDFALASGNVGVMGATNEVVHQREFQTIFWVYVTITISCCFPIRRWLRWLRW